MHSRACTQASLSPLGAERLQGAAQLVGLRPVFGVVDHREAAAHERQRNVERLRLGARAGRRNGDDRNRNATAARGDGGAGLAVVGFQRDDDVELLGRIVEPLDGAQQTVDGSRLAVERGDHAVHRQRVVGYRHRRRRRRRDEGGGKAQAEPGQEQRGERHRHHIQGDHRRGDGAGHRHDAGKRERHWNLKRRPRAGGKLREGLLQAVRRAGGDGLAAMAQHETVEPLGGGEAEAWRQRRIALQHGDEPAHRPPARRHYHREIVAVREGQQPGQRGFDQRVVIDRAARARDAVERLEGDAQVVAERPQIGLFAQTASGNQHPVGADADRRRAFLGRRKGRLRQQPLDAVEFREAPTVEKIGPGGGLAQPRDGRRRPATAAYRTHGAPDGRARPKAKLHTPPQFPAEGYMRRQSPGYNKLHSRRRTRGAGRPPAAISGMAPPRHGC